MTTLKERMEELREKIKNNPKRNKQRITIKLPVYDEVYFEGLRWLDWLAYSESLAICAYFQRIYKGIECTAYNCPCDLYEIENKNE